MPGRKPLKVYLYNDDGEFMKSFNSQAEFSNEFNLSKNLLSQQNPFIFKSGEVACTYRIGRENIRVLKKKLASKYLGKGYKTSLTKRSPKVEVYDLENNLIASFKSTFHFKLMTGIIPRKKRIYS